jgi:hypothetical protein
VRGVRVIEREAGAVSWEIGLRSVDVDIDEAGRVIEIVGTAATLGCLNIGSSNSSSPVISSEGAGACTDDVRETHCTFPISTLWPRRNRQGVVEVVLLPKSRGAA